MAENTGIAPRALKDRPELHQRWHFAKEVFDDLTGSRNYTVEGPANIPITAYDCHARGYGFTPSEWRSNWEDLRTSDTVWLEERAKRKKSEEGRK